MVTSLAAHPIQFRIDGNTVSGIAIGSVYTTKDVRGRGLAPLLIAWVEDYKQRQGTGLSVLYSDIKPEYYVRLGYALCPSWEGFREAANEAASAKLSYRLAQSTSRNTCRESSRRMRNITGLCRYRSLVTTITGA